MNMKIVEMTSSWGSLSMPILPQPLIDIIMSDAMECYKDSVSIRDRIFINFRCCYLSLVMRKPAFCICENKDADQLRGNREADQRLCFRYTDSTIPLLPKSEISSL